MPKKLIYDVLKTESIQDKAVVMIHGWKGNKNSFKSIASLLKLDNTTWFFPEAPFEFEGDNTKKTWTYQKNSGEWEVEEPKALLNDFFKSVVFKKFNPHQVYIMGFSQGATVCYEFILGLDYKFAGIFPIAGFLRKPMEPLFISPLQYDTPILIGHGKDDDVVPFEASEIAYNKIKKVCSNVNLKAYNGKHKIGVDYLREAKKLIGSPLI